MAFCDKILAPDLLPGWRDEVRRSGRRLVVTNGCFDLLHIGHATMLEAAKAHGDVLLVGVNSDASVRRLKGPRRPVSPEHDRAAMVAAMGCVDAVVVFDETTAESFLRQAAPDVWAKGGDYTLDQLPIAERCVVESLGGRVVIVPRVTGRSTTATLERIEGSLRGKEEWSGR